MAKKPENHNRQNGLNVQNNQSGRKPRNGRNCQFNRKCQNGLNGIMVKRAKLIKMANLIGKLRRIKWPEWAIKQKWPKYPIWQTWPKKPKWAK